MIRRVCWRVNSLVSYRYLLSSLTWRRNDFSNSRSPTCVKFGMDAHSASAPEVKVKVKLQGQNRRRPTENHHPLAIARRGLG